MLKTLWITALIGSAMGLIVLVVALFGFSDNSMHLAALAAVSVALAAVPYCLARAKSALVKIKTLASPTDSSGC